MQNSLKRLRKERGFTLKQLSHKSGVALSTISNFELGRSGMSPEFLKKIAGILAVSPAEILTDSGSGARVREEPAADYHGSAGLMEALTFIISRANPRQLAQAAALLDSTYRRVIGEEGVASPEQAVRPGPEKPGQSPAPGK